MAFIALAAFSLLWPERAGFIGRLLGRVLYASLGQASYLLLAGLALWVCRARPGAPLRGGDSEPAAGGEGRAILPVLEEPRGAPPAVAPFSPACGSARVAFDPGEALQLLDAPDGESPQSAGVEELRTLLERALQEFLVPARVAEVDEGPAVSRYALALENGTKVSSVLAVLPDLEARLKARIRHCPLYNGAAAMALEIPNPSRRTVRLRELLESLSFAQSQAPLTFGLGLATDGSPVVADLTAMPHLLIAGATGVGKSMAMHSAILSILLKARPGSARFVFVDPKHVEFGRYESLPAAYGLGGNHPAVCTDAETASRVLWELVPLMESRFAKYRAAGVRDIRAYNDRIAGTNGGREPYVVVCIDELADLLLDPKMNGEAAIVRLAQKARACGIHIIAATQRPSADVLTGHIKANMPARLALKTVSRTNSRIILDLPGAEALLGYGDALFLAPGGADPCRVQGPLVSDDEIDRVIEWLQASFRRLSLPSSLTALVR